MMPIGFGRAICGDLIQAERREWWVANGLGGYAAGTVAGSLTRAYHGLLVAPIEPPLGRLLLLTKADAWLEDGAESWPLCTNRWASGAVEPRGHVHLEHFELNGSIPTWRYAIGDRVVESAIWMEQGRNTTYVAWRLLAGPPARLRVQLLANRRSYHGGAAGIEQVTYAGSQITVRGARGPDLRILAPEGEVTSDQSWYENFYLPLEHERGLPDRDRHLCVGAVQFALSGAWVGIVASTEAETCADIASALQRQRDYDRAVIARAQNALPERANAPGWVQRLILAADGFLFERPQGTSVIAGYPWFTDWGRDSMIALPGLTLATGQPEKALRILQTFAGFVDSGMLPNVFPGDGATPEYNTVDATLWFIEAWDRYWRATGNVAALRQVFPTLQDIIAWHIRGTRFGIGVDPVDGLLAAGEAGVQLTWMDAKVGNHVMTPRRGKPVEVNALWYNALCIMADFATALGMEPTPYKTQAARVSAAFARFVRADGRGLFDVLDPLDASERPNQIFAVSLRHSPLHPEVQRAVVERVGQTLLCSVGLRSLAPDDGAYCPVYAGDVAARDGAYHQGTVWAWLLGPFALAYARVTSDTAGALARLAPIGDHLTDAGLGTVSEIFDGAAPHVPRGCPAQAWSVATVLDAWCQISPLAAP
jgi:4-alpha-glucanotransferase